MYGDQPYEYHLQMAVDAAEQFIYLIDEQDRDNVIATIWCHDVIEDCRQTYNDVKNATNKTVADLVYALTNEKGRNRKEKANDKYYEGIRQVHYATFCKCCDRIANISHSVKNNDSMLKMYKKEFIHFEQQLRVSKYADMFDYMVTLMQSEH